MNLRDMLVNLGDLFYYKSLEAELREVESVLDVGCGDNSPLAKVKKTFHSVGADVHAPSIKKSKKAKIHNEYKIVNVLKLHTIFKPKSFDAVIALDVVEHFKKKDGLRLIKSMERIAKKKVIILTPRGFVKQDPFDGNPFQEHKSGWTVDEFRRMGYKAYGMRGIWFIRGEYATIKYKPWIVWGIISTLSQLFVFSAPAYAYQILGVKEKKR